MLVIYDSSAFRVYDLSLNRVVLTRSFDLRGVMGGLRLPATGSRMTKIEAIDPDWGVVRIFVNTFFNSKSLLLVTKGARVFEYDFDLGNKNLKIDLKQRKNRQSNSILPLLSLSTPQNCRFLLKKAEKSQFFNISNF